MSFSREVKNELCRISELNSSALKAEITGILVCRGSLMINQGVKRIVVNLDYGRVGRRLYRVMKGLYNVDIEILVYGRGNLKRVHSYSLVISKKDGEVDDILTDLHLDLLRSNVIPEYIIYNGDTAHFLRGVFLSAGSISDPAKSYHLEINSEFPNLPFRLKETLERELNVHGNVAEHEKKWRYYVKNSFDIIKLLETMGCPRHAAVIEKIKKGRTLENKVLRSVNLTFANADRIARSSAKQQRAIKIIDATVGISNLSEDLRFVAELRMKNPYMSMKELGQSMRPPISKDKIWAKMKKLIKIANAIESSPRGEPENGKKGI